MMQVGEETVLVVKALGIELASHWKEAWIARHLVKKINEGENKCVTSYYTYHFLFGYKSRTGHGSLRGHLHGAVSHLNIWLKRKPRLTYACLFLRFGTSFFVRVSPSFSFPLSRRGTGSSDSASLCDTSEPSSSSESSTVWVFARAFCAFRRAPNDNECSPAC